MDPDTLGTLYSSADDDEEDFIASDAGPRATSSPSSAGRRRGRPNYDTLGSGYFELQDKPSKIQRMTGVAGEYVQPTDRYSLEWARKELESILQASREPMIRFLLRVAGEINAELVDLISAPAFLSMTSKILDSLNQFYPESGREAAVQSLKQSRPDLQELKRRDAAAAAASAGQGGIFGSLLNDENVIVNSQTKAFLSTVDTMQLNLEPYQLQTEEFERWGSWVKFFLENAVIYLRNSPATPAVSLSTDEDGPYSNNQQSDGAREHFFDHLASSLQAKLTRNRKEPVLEPSERALLVVMKSIKPAMVRLMTPAIQERWKKVCIPEIRYELETEWQKQSREKLISEVLNVKSDIPPARAEKLGLGRPMPVDNKFNALRWMHQEDGTPRMVDLDIMTQMFA